jgi:hypothetical protein
MAKAALVSPAARHVSLAGPEHRGRWLLAGRDVPLHNSRSASPEQSKKAVSEEIAMRLVLCATCVVAACLFNSAPVRAQVTTADIIGRVTDDTGALVPGALVTVQSLATGAVRSMPTSASGDYAFSLLSMGPYAVRFELQGFGVQTASVTLASGDRARIDVRLAPGAVEERVIVAADRAPLLNTDSSARGTLINLTQVQDLPTNGRNFVRVVQSVPGANEGQPNSLASGTRPDDRRPTSAVSINGALDNQNNWLIDGIDNNERAIGTIGVKPSIDAIAELKIQTGLYTAEVGRTGGGVVNIITKAGSNQLHGSGFTFVRNDRFDARHFFATTKPSLRQNQFGGSLGGPIRTNRTFFFVDYEMLRHTSGVVNVVTVPTLGMRAGDFSELPVTIYDPTTNPRTPFPGNRVPANRLDPIALRYLSLYPNPTTSGTANNYSGIRERTQNSSTADLRIDHRFSDTSTVFARYSWNDVDTFTPGAVPPVSGIEPGGNNGQFPGPNVTAVHSVQANFLRIFSPTLLSELKAGYLNADMQSLPLNYGSNASREFGLPNVNIDELTSALSPMTIAGVATLGSAQFIPLILADNTLQFSATLMKTRGAHNIKIGGGLIARKFTLFQSESAVGRFTFDTRLTNDGLGNGGSGLASFLLGYPSSVARSHSLVYPRYHTNEPHAFFQDDWRIASRLTVNLGLRYDVFTPLTEEDDRLSNFDAATARIIVANRNGTSRTAGVATDYGNVAPRLGLSATLPNRIVVRGGYGLSYWPGNQGSPTLMKNQPFSSVYGPVLSAGTVGDSPSLRLADGLPLPTPTDYVNPSGSIVGVARDFKPTRAQQFHLTVEKEFAGSTVAASYVGSRATHLAFSEEINLAPVGPGAVQPRRAFAARLPEVTSITMLTSDFQSFYDAMQLVFERRYSRGLAFNVNYTLAQNEVTQPAPWDSALTERFDADNDVRHRWAVSFNYEITVHDNASAPMRRVLSGWQINLLGSWQTGLPIDIFSQTPRVNTGAGDRPNLVGNPNIDHPTVARWFDASAFTAQPVNTVGDQVVKRNLLHGPPQRRIDLSVFKNMKLSRSSALQLRAEVFNVTNTPSFGNPNGQFGSPSFGAISTIVGAPRQMQFAAKLLF